VLAAGEEDAFWAGSAALPQFELVQLWQQALAAGSGFCRLWFGWFSSNNWFRSFFAWQHLLSYR